MYRLVAVALLFAGTPALAEDDTASAVLDNKNGFRDAKLGADFATFEGMKPAGKSNNLLYFRRETDKLSLFKVELQGIGYGFKDALLDEIIITGGWSLKARIKPCEVDNDHVLANLIKAFGKATTTHSYSSTEGKRCIRNYRGGLTAPYCRVREWRGKKVRMSLFQIVTNGPAAAPTGTDKPEDWNGHSCRWVLEYARIANPLDEL